VMPSAGSVRRGRSPDDVPPRRSGRLARPAARESPERSPAREPERSAHRARGVDPGGPVLSRRACPPTSHERRPEARRRR
jgi:hypothetical protein